MQIGCRVKLSSIATVCSALSSLTSHQASAGDKVLMAAAPAHTEWCSTSSFPKDAILNPVGREAVFSAGSAPILNAAFKAGASRIGHVYILKVEPSDAQISATFCAVVPTSLLTGDGAITITRTPSIAYLAEVCADADQCMADISAALKGDPYKLTDDQLRDVEWRFASSPSSDNTADAVISALNETDSTQISGAIGIDQTSSPASPVFNVVAAQAPSSAH
jgi:hypothetical protein